MPRDPQILFASPTLAETALASRRGLSRQIPVEGYGPARRVLAGIVAVALAIGAALPVRAATDDLATGLAALGALALIAGETEGNPLPRVAPPPPEREVRFRQDTGPRDSCRHEMGPPHGNAWGYRARHGCAPAPGHKDGHPVKHGRGHGKGHDKHHGH